MKKSHLYRFSAICSLISGLFLTIGWTLNINRDSLVGAFMVLIAYVLAIFAFMGIYGVQYKQLKIIGFLGFIFLIVANTVFVPWLFLDIAIISGVAQQVNWKEVQDIGPTHVIAVIGGIGFVLGFFLLGVDTIRAKVFSKWPAILLIIAGIMPLIYTCLPIGKLLPRIAGLALLGFSWNLWIL
ncbi:MAG: hypothetical protein COA50_11095 [Flavobacteriaceae bacterium]|nr:MAG: hypothetical protein COA50_11095 [Flavobacteriaceae bacterium]